MAGPESLLSTLELQVPCSGVSFLLEYAHRGGNPEREYCMSLGVNEVQTTADITGHRMCMQRPICMSAPIRYAT